MGRLLGAVVLQALVLLVPLGVFGAGMVVGLQAFSDQPVIVLILGVAVLPMLLVLVLLARWYVLIPCIVLEGRGPVAALQRSWTLTATRVWPVVGLVLLTGMLSFLFTTVPTLVAQQAGRVFGFSATAVPWSTVGLDLLTLVGTIITTPFLHVVEVLLYYDLRIRTEGYDVEVAVAHMAS